MINSIMVGNKSSLAVQLLKYGDCNHLCKFRMCANLECMAKITLNKITIMHIRDLFLYLNQLLPPVYIQINHAGSNNEFSAGFSIFEQR